MLVKYKVHSSSRQFITPHVTSTVALSCVADSTYMHKHTHKYSSTAYYHNMYSAIIKITKTTTALFNFSLPL